MGLQRSALAAVAALATLAAVVGGAGAQADRSCRKVMSNDTDAVLVSNPLELQKALLPRSAAELNLICFNGDADLEALSFLPRMRLTRDTALCGARTRATLKVLEDFKLASVDGPLTLCNMTLDLTASALGGAALEDLLWDLGPRGSLRYANMAIFVGSGTFEGLSSALGGPGGGGAATVRGFTLGATRITLANATLGRTTFQDVQVEMDDPPQDFEDGVETVALNNTRDVAQFRKGRRRDDAELRVDVLADLGLSRCLLFAVSGSNDPIPVERPVTVATAGGGGSRRLEFNSDLRRGFLDVQYQLRLDGVAIVNEAVSLELGVAGQRSGSGCALSEPGCFERSVDTEGIEVKVHREMFKLRALDGCRLVTRDAVLVHGCEFVTALSQLLLYHRNNIQGHTRLLQWLNSTIEISEYEAVGKTIKFTRFVGLGWCMENSTMTCNALTGAKAPEPRCRMFENTDRTDPEVTTDLSDSNYYKEPDSSGDEDGNNTSAYMATSSDFENLNTSDQQEEAAANATGAVLVGGGVFLWVVTMALFCKWYLASKARSKRQHDSDLAEAGNLKKNGEEQDGERRWLGATSQSSNSQSNSGRGDGRFIKSVKTKKPGDINSSSITRESLIGAISSATAGIEDSSARIQRQIAAGGSGVVYKGTWKNIPVAIKTVVFQDLADSSNRQKQRAIFEAAISSSVAHKNIVQTYAYSFKRLHASTMMGSDLRDPKHVNIESSTLNTGVVVDWKLYIVQEFCDGGSLRECLDGKKVLDKEDSRPMLGTICQLAFEAASGMCHLHSQHNIVHGDLSSKNILLKKDPGDDPDALGVAKIADFGLSIKMGLLQSHISNQRAGTPFYMAPELCHQGILSKKADVFSFGVFMWELYHSKKCYHMNAKTGMQYHPLFPKFPIMCPIPYAMLCVVCISPKPENRPDFDFIARVFAALKRQADSGMFADFEEVRLRNMGLAAGLGRMTAPKILELIAEQVGISIVDSSAVCSTTRDESYSLQSESVDISNSIKFPHTMFLPSTQMWSRGGDSVVDHSKSGDVEIHLSQAYVAPFNCIVTVSVSTEHGPDAPKGGAPAEHFDISWQCELEEGGGWEDSIPGDHKAGASANRVDAACSTANGSVGARGHGVELEMSSNPVSQDGSESGKPGPSSVVNGEGLQLSLKSRWAALSPTSESSPSTSPKGHGNRFKNQEEAGRRTAPGSVGPSRASPRSHGAGTIVRAAGVRQERVSPTVGVIPMAHVLPSVREEIEPASEVGRDGANTVGVRSVDTPGTEDTLHVQSAFMPSPEVSEDGECEDPHSHLLEGSIHSDTYPDGAYQFPSLS